MALDFSEIYRISGHTEHNVQEIQNILPTIVTEKERAKLERAAAAGLNASKRAAAATVASEQGRGEILKGLAAGADIYRLFLTACDTISKATGDTVFSAQAQEYIRDIYGKALGEKTPLKAELDAVQTRSDKIKQFMEREDIDARERENARRAYRAHQNAAAQLLNQISA